MIKKKIISGILVFALMLGLCACDSSSPESTSSDETPTSTDITSKDEPTGGSDSVTVYTAMTHDESDGIFKRFEEETGIKVNMVRLSSGELFARVQAEASNPKASVWYVTSVDTMTVAAKDGLLEPYVSPNIEGVPEDIRDADGYWTPAFRSIMGMLTNDKYLEEHNIETPSEFKDLLDPVYKDQVVMAHPATSGMAHAWLNTMVFSYGEEGAFEFFHDINSNIYQFTKGGGAPARMVCLGEAAACFAFAHDAYANVKEGYEVTYTVPATPGAELSGIALIKNGLPEEQENAKKLIDWTILPETQQYIVDTFYRFPVTDDVDIPMYLGDLSNLDYVEMDFAWSSENRERLIKRFEDEIRGQENLAE